MEPVRREIAPEVCLNYVRSDKFKTGTLSMQFITPLDEKTASFGALLPSVLRRGTMAHPDMRALSTALDLLYGSSIGCTVRKRARTSASALPRASSTRHLFPAGRSSLSRCATFWASCCSTP